MVISSTDVTRVWLKTGYHLALNPTQEPAPKRSGH
jgi:hypothetical protein